MANFFTSPFSTFIRGAQTTIHEWQMLVQSFRQTLVAGLIIVAGLSACQIAQKTTAHERYILERWVAATLQVALHGPKGTITFTDEKKRKHQLYAAKYLRSTMVRDAWDKTLRAALIGVMIGAALSSLIILSVLLFFYVNGRRQGRDFHLRGARLGTMGELAKALRQFGKKGAISLGGIQLPEEMEPTNVAMVGAPRTGKSQQIAEILDGIRKAGQKAILYDYGGLFTRHYYREGHDIVLNPMDARSAQWLPWFDASEPAHFDQQAASLIPDSDSGEDFWPKAARTVYTALARHPAIAGVLSSRQLYDFLDWGLKRNIDDLTMFLAGTEAMSALGVDRTAASVRSHLATYLKSFNYLNQTGDPFSIRSWV